MSYNWQQPDCPDFSYDLQAVEDALFAFAEETGHVTGILKGMPEDVQMEAIINTMVAEAVKTSAIEGEFISREDVVSSIRNKLGLNAKPDPVRDKRASGAGELMVDIQHTYAETLTKEKLFEWHKMLLKQSRGYQSGGLAQGR